MEGHIRVVIDTSIFIKLLKPDSYTRKVFYGTVAVITPYLIYEIYKHRKRISNFTGISEDELMKVIGHLLEFCEIRPETEYFDRWEEAYELAKQFDEKDTPFIALAMKLSIPIWTNDKQMIIHGLKTRKYIALDTQAVEELIKGKQLEEVLENLKKRYLTSRNK